MYSNLIFNMVHFFGNNNLNGYFFGRWAPKTLLPLFSGKSPYKIPKRYKTGMLAYLCYFALKMDRLDDILKNGQLYCSTVAWEIPMLVVAWLKAHPHVY